MSYLVAAGCKFLFTMSAMAHEKHNINIYYFLYDKLELHVLCVKSDLLICTLLFFFLIDTCLAVCLMTVVSSLWFLTYFWVIFYKDKLMISALVMVAPFLLAFVQQMPLLFLLFSTSIRWLSFTHLHPNHSHCPVPWKMQISHACCLLSSCGYGTSCCFGIKYYLELLV